MKSRRRNTCILNYIYIDYRRLPRKPNHSKQTATVLNVLLGAPRDWHYGYDLSRQTGLAPGTMYPILKRLTECGWLEAAWVQSCQNGRPPRHQYKLTSAGARQAREVVNSSLSRLEASARHA